MKKIIIGTWPLSGVMDIYHCLKFIKRSHIRLKINFMNMILLLHMGMVL